MTPRAARMLELALALRQARATASHLEAELGELVERPQRRRFSSLGGGSGTPAAGCEDVPLPVPPPAEVADVPGLPERPLRRTEELPPLEPDKRSHRRGRWGASRCSECGDVDHIVSTCPVAGLRTPPARLDELRRQIAAGTYVPFETLRRAVAR